jgi:hypothetical protein
MESEEIRLRVRHFAAALGFEPNRDLGGSRIVPVSALRVNKLWQMTSGPTGYEIAGIGAAIPL